VSTRQPYASPGDQIAVVSQSGPTITFLDATDHRVLAVLEVPSEPHELCFDPDHRVVYCSHTYFAGFYDGNAGRHHLLTVVDADTHEVIETIDVSPEHGPHGFALDTERSLLYVSLESGPAGPGGVLVLDTDTRKIVGRIDSEAPGPHWYIIDPAGERGYASNKEADFVSVLDLQTRTLVDKWAVPGSEGIAISPDGSTLAVAAPKANLGQLAAEPGVRLFDTSTGELVRTLPTEDVVVPLNWTADGVLLAGQVGTPAPDTADENGVINPFAMTDPPPGHLLVWTGSTPGEMQLAGRSGVEMSMTVSTEPAMAET
jgi:DNA-binding beta-propeller fold protein YncE